MNESEEWDRHYVSGKRSTSKTFFPLTPRLINGNLNVNKNTEMGARHILGNRWRQAQVRRSRFVVTTEVILQFDHLTHRKEDIDEIGTRPLLLNNIWWRCLPFGQSIVPMLYLNVIIPWINASLWKWNKNQGRILKITSKMKLRLWYFAKTKDIFRQL